MLALLSLMQGDSHWIIHGGIKPDFGWHRACREMQDDKIGCCPEQEQEPDLEIIKLETGSRKRADEDAVISVLTVNSSCCANTAQEESVHQPVAMPTDGKKKTFEWAFSGATDENNLFSLEWNKTSGRQCLLLRSVQPEHWVDITASCMSVGGCCDWQTMRIKKPIKERERERETLYLLHTRSSIFGCWRNFTKAFHRAPHWKFMSSYLPSHQWYQQELNITDCCQGARPKSKRLFIHNTNRAETAERCGEESPNST